ncbi:IS110 family transposase [Streptomyces sp. Tue 6430]|nr:IS110 family transposase [Streptomyces sp. Tue 6430]
MAAVLSPVGEGIGVEVFPATAAGHGEPPAWAGGPGAVRRAGVAGPALSGLLRPATLPGRFRPATCRPGAWRCSGETGPSGQTAAGAASPTRPLPGTRPGRCWAGGAGRARAGRAGRRTGADRPDARTRQGLGGRSPHPGDQPARGCPRRCRPAPAGRTGRAARRGTPPCPRTVRRRQQERRRRRGGAADDPRHPVSACPADRTTRRVYAGLGTPTGPARGTPCPAAAHGGGLRPGRSRHVADHEGDDPERPGGEASFTALCGADPVERSSGSRQYRRPDRGGDRQTDTAPHRIARTRLRAGPRTRDHCGRRGREDKTRREIVRCLKRYAAREVFHRVGPTQP